MNPGQSPRVVTTRGGLECGVLAGRIPGLDAVSFGPTAERARSVGERAHATPVAACCRVLARALRAVGKAVTEAKKEVEELKDAAAALGMGLGQPGSNDPRAIAELYKRVRNDPALRKICDLAGRFRRVAASRQRQKVSHGLDDVVGVEPGGDIGRLLPSELVRLAVPELELDTLRRIVERQAMCREHHAVDPRGPRPPRAGACPDAGVPGH